MWGDGKSVVSRLNAPRNLRLSPAAHRLLLFQTRPRQPPSFIPRFLFPSAPLDLQRRFPLLGTTPLLIPPSLAHTLRQAAAWVLGCRLCRHSPRTICCITPPLLEQCSRCLVSGSKHDCSHNFARGRCNN